MWSRLALSSQSSCISLQSAGSWDHRWRHHNCLEMTLQHRLSWMHLFFSFFFEELSFLFNWYVTEHIFAHIRSSLLKSQFLFFFLNSLRIPIWSILPLIHLPTIPPLLSLYLFLSISHCSRTWWRDSIAKDTADCSHRVWRNQACIDLGTSSPVSGYHSAKK